MIGELNSCFVGGRNAASDLLGGRGVGERRRACACTAGAMLLVVIVASVASAQTIEVDGHFGAACSGAEFSCRDLGAPTLGTGLRVRLGGSWSVGGRFDHISAKDRRIPPVVMSRSRQFVGAEGAADVGGMDRPHVRLAGGLGWLRETVDLRCEEPGCGADASRTAWRSGAILFGVDVLVPVRPTWSILAGSRFFMGPQGTSFAIYGGALLLFGSQ